MNKLTSSPVFWVVGVLLIFGLGAYLTVDYIQKDKERALSLSSAAETNELFPVANGFYSEWDAFPRATQDYQAVDELTCNGKTDYVLTDAVGSKESFKLDLASIPNGAIITTVEISPCASTDMGQGYKSPTHQMAVFYRLNGKDQTPSASYKLPPRTPQSLSSSKFSNLSITKYATTSLEIGATYASGNRDVILSRLAAKITYELPLPTPIPVSGAVLKVSLTSDTNSSLANNTHVVAGTAAYSFTKYVLDAAGSSEDIKVSLMGLRIGLVTPNTADDLKNCQLFDGTTPLNTGTKAIYLSNLAVDGDLLGFIFDAPLTVTKGTSKTLILKCDVVSGAVDGTIWQWGITNETNSVVSTGVTSGVTVNETITADNGRQVKAQTSGTLSVSLDSSTPAASNQPAGSVNVPLTILRFDGVVENISLQQLTLQFNGSNVSALNKYTVWLGSTMVGEGVFASSKFSTTTLTGVTIPANGTALLTIKGSLSNVGTGFPAQAGDTVSIDFDGGSAKGTIGVGMNSGVSIYPVNPQDTIANKVTLTAP